MTSIIIGKFILLLFIGVMAAAGCWSELIGGWFWEVYNVLVYVESFGLVAPERLVAFRKGY